MIFAAICVFIVLLIFIDIRNAIIILLIVAMIDIELLGWMYLINVSYGSWFNNDVFSVSYLCGCYACMFFFFFVTIFF